MINIENYQLVFWDFDGTIKESIDAKADAFVSVFMKYGESVTGRIRSHHYENGGVSRYDKIPLYLEWSGEAVTEELVSEFCEKFSNSVVSKVISSAWVPGVKEYIKNSCDKQNHILITATPKDEILKIILNTGMEGCFVSVFGAPIDKTKTVSHVISDNNIRKDEVLVIGDSWADMNAAHINDVDFFLRANKYNFDIQKINGVECFERL